MSERAFAADRVSLRVAQDPAQVSSRAGARYATITAVFIALLIISNIVAVKLIAFGPFQLGDWVFSFIVDGGVYLFPLVYITGDVLAEVYGWRASRRAILTAFAMALLAALTIWIVQISPADPSWTNQAAFESVLGFVPRIVAASLGGFLAGQMVNAWVLVWLKSRSGERLLRTRLIASTLAGQFVDTLVFCTIAFFGVLEGWDFLGYVALGYAIKCLAEVVLLPITTRVIDAVRRAEDREARLGANLAPTVVSTAGN